MPMATLQVKHLPAELHDELKRRAARSGITMSELVTRMLRRELSLPTMADWLAELGTTPVRDTDIDISALMDDVRSDDARA